MVQVLVIEDEQFIRETVVEILEDEGYEVLAADNGLTGYELALQFQPNLILCDIMMPGLDGYQLLKKLRSNPLTVTISFIYLTAKDQRNDYRAGMNLGADDYLVKPFTKTELLEAVESRIAKQLREQDQYLFKLRTEEEKFKELIYYDRITKLPNQLLLQQYFQDILNRFKFNGQTIKIRNLIVYCIEFTQLNLLESRLEPSKFEALQIDLANRLRSFTASDELVVRLKTEQFLLLLQKENNLETISQIAQNIIIILSEEFKIDGQNISLNVNLGVSVYPEDGTSINQLIKKAEIGLSYAKHERSNHYRIYTNDLITTSLEQLELENDLRHAIVQKEFQLYYQPLVSFPPEKIIGVEALIRWKHPKKGFIPPVKFIPLAESTGLIIPIGEWVLKTACEQMKAWQLAGYPPMRVGVNLSSRQLNDTNLIQIVKKHIQDTGLEPHLLDLEITETLMIENPKLASENFEKLKQLGVKISIDDFGTGYSSFGYLYQFPFDHLKVDRVFIQNIDKEPKKAEITKAILQIAQNLDITVVAEGVETEAELEVLKRYQFHEFQGYYFSRPLPASDLEKLL